MKEAFENVMTAVKDIPTSEIKEGDTLFLVTSDMGKSTCFAKGKVIAIAGGLAMAAIKHPDILKALKAAVLMAEEDVNRDSANK